jgi:hypothetical protein
MTLPLPVRLAALAFALAAALPGCKRENKTQEARTAQGEILPGSASDAMLPLDTVRSQPPLAPVEAATGKPGKRAAAGHGEDTRPGATEEAGPPKPGASPSIAADPAVAQ